MWFGIVEINWMGEPLKFGVLSYLELLEIEKNNRIELLRIQLGTIQISSILKTSFDI